MKFLHVLILFLMFGSISLTAAVDFTAAQDDTVLAKEALSPPVIDGKADDACWADAQWQAIDQVWITWGEQMDAADFIGQYKVCWSSETDRIYFLVEVVDDVLVDGYKYPMDGYYNWDVVEIFFDEDASRGDHKLNQNAFAYHITAGNDDVEFEAMDLTANWAAVNYSDHLECQIEYVDGKYIWEISMIVYNENYDPSKTDNPIEQLEAGKVSGLSIAYCDNDDPDEEPKTRDNFIGSVAVPQANFNDHWMNADWFGTMKLVSATFVQNKTASPDAFVLHQNYPNPFNPNTTISFRLPVDADVRLDIYNALGQKVKTLTHAMLAAGTHAIQWDGLNDAGQAVNSGLYLYQLKAVTAHGALQHTQKMILSR